MLHFQFPHKVKLVCPLLYADEQAYSKVKAALTRKFGPIDYESEPLDFRYTDYYTTEMGETLTRRFIAFRKLQAPDRFVTIKRWCVALEKKFAPGGRRRINIDPGYIDEAKLVLTTTKDFAHRIYMGKGVFAEVTLSYRDGAFQERETTFPDYRTAVYKEILKRIRAIYREQVHGRQ